MLTNCTVMFFNYMNVQDFRIKAVSENRLKTADYQEGLILIK